MTSEHIVMISDSDFDEKVLKSDKPVLVDFFANWCGPCKMIAPYLENLAEEYQGRVTVAKLDVDQNGQSAMRYGVRGIPTMILFDQGKQKEVVVGADPNRIRDIIAQAA